MNQATRRLLQLILIAAAINLGGCAVYQIEITAHRYHQVASSLSVGQSKSEALAILLPTQDSIGEYGRDPVSYFKDDQINEVYYMRSQRISDGLKTDDEFVPYLFVEDKLEGIGWEALGGAKTIGTPYSMF